MRNAEEFSLNLINLSIFTDFKTLLNLFKIKNYLNIKVRTFN
jgi:hypothetical protein